MNGIRDLRLVLRTPGKGRYDAEGLPPEALKREPGDPAPPPARRLYRCYEHGELDAPLWLSDVPYCGWLTCERRVEPVDAPAPSSRTHKRTTPKLPTTKEVPMSETEPKYGRGELLRKLLAFLENEPGKAMRMDALAELLWPGVDRRVRMARLGAAVSKLVTQRLVDRKSGVVTLRPPREPLEDEDDTAPHAHAAAPATIGDAALPRAPAIAARSDGIGGWVVTEAVLAKPAPGTEHLVATVAELRAEVAALDVRRTALQHAIEVLERILAQRSKPAA